MSLPKDVLVSILGYLNPASIASASSVCFLWNESSKNIKYSRKMAASQTLRPMTSPFLQSCFANSNNAQQFAIPQNSPRPPTRRPSSSCIVRPTNSEFMFF
uniref:F-box domain-containing protein n=1 Tax=Mucochytrium quahogii TaxID=96639 RepID=A0A7S2RTX1_9STRA